MEDSTGDDSKENLISSERMVSSSPVMWPDQNCFAELDSVSSVAPNWLHDIEKDDKKMLTELASLTQQQLLQKIQALQTFAYHLGIQEAKQMRRGTCLQVFDSSRRNGQHSNNVSRDPFPSCHNTNTNTTTTHNIPAPLTQQNQQN